MPRNTLRALVALAARRQLEPDEGKTLGRLMRAHAALSLSAEILVRARSEDELLRDLCRILVEDCGYPMAWVGYPGHDAERHVEIRARMGDTTGYLDRVDIRWSDCPQGQGPTGVAIRTGEVRVARNFLEDPRFAPWRQEATQCGFASSIALPLFEGKERIGALNVYAPEPDAFDESEVELLSQLAENLVFGIRNLRAVEQQRRTETELKATTELFRSVYQNSPDAIFLHGPDGSLVDANRSTQELYKGDLDTLIRTPPERFMGEGHDFTQVQRHLAAAMAGEAEDFEWTARDLEGHTFPVEVRLRRIHGPEVPGEPRVMALVRDLRERKAAERDRLLAQKLASIGVLAGGIAHDFNNLLTGILGNISLLLTDLQDPELQESAREAALACDRAQKLTQQLLTFSKGGMPQRAPLDLRSLVTQAASFALRGSGTTCRYAIADDLWPVHADAGQVGQIVQNLVINARQAMQDSGQVTVAAENLVIGAEDPYWREVGVHPGEYVQLTVTDEGPGVPREAVDCVFDPYFTTKDEGTGIGLAAAFSIARSHEGHLRLASEPDSPAVFSLVLPRGGDIAPPTGSSQREQARASLEVLVMDDVEILRKVAGRILTRAGHRVEITCTGEEAIAAYRRALAEGRRFDVVVLDLTVVGGLGGVETLQALRELDPGLRAIASSGYIAGGVFDHFEAQGFVGVLLKPYRATELLDAVERAMEEPLP